MLTQASPAQAAKYCQPGDNSSWPDFEVDYEDEKRKTGDFMYRAYLHGVGIELVTDSGNASVYAHAVSGLRAGDILSIDRTNFTVDRVVGEAAWGKTWDGDALHFFRETYTMEAHGTWDYCERAAATDWDILFRSEGVRTARIDGSNHFVRPCLRRGGQLQCSNMWYGDMDGAVRPPLPSSPTWASPVNPPEEGFGTAPTTTTTPPVAFQANTGFLYTHSNVGITTNTGYGMAAGTSPATSDGQTAFQANTSFLYTRSASGVMTNTGYGMMAGTSPAISGGQVAFQANTGFLWTRNTATGATFDTGLGMMRGTSPSIAGNTSSWRIAFQANNGFLYTRDSSGAIVNTGYGMMAGTSPAITKLSNGTYAIAFQANTGFLYVMNTGAASDTRYGMMAGTSPAITASGTGFTVAFQANTGFLYTRSSTGATTNTGYGMMRGTSPAIRGSRLVFQGNTGFLYMRDGTGNALDTRYGMMAGTSPAV
ncbi:hypothetical protein [Couchioplanes azureus]|uniref:hypothetical protein n=1 Tax=Couchioplanes caeruleus TaxID=56438 RepID=UPI0016710EC8|nr:hypothetical protein [Couchioplanes caeruleus]GGQ84808.1 hypothetical protein GCM10010166_63810 [Couchioplanes caeruleus subsp. azureus]